VLVTTPGGTNSANTLFTYVTPVSAPTVTAISPTSGTTAGGTSVTITGTNLTSASVVTIGGNACTPLSANTSTSVTCTTSAGSAGTASVLVTTPGGSNSANTLFTYVTPVAAPTVTAISPTSGTTAGGTSVTITGTNLTNASAVTIGGNACTPLSANTATSVTCTTSAGSAGTASVLVTTPGGTNSANTLFTYTANTNSACGGAQGQATSVLPSLNLCSIGNASSVTASAGGYSWSCTGSGNPASCTAPGTTAPGTTVTTTTELVSSAGCRLSSASPLLAPNGGPGGGVTLPYGVVNFELLDCTANGLATVRMTYSGPVGGMSLWKYGPYPTPTGAVRWYQMTDGVAVSGNTITFTIQDQGLGDSDNRPGVIADPAGPGTSNALAGSPTSIPTLSEWGMILMSALLGLFGLAQVRRQR